MALLSSSLCAEQSRATLAQVTWYVTSVRPRFVAQHSGRCRVCVGLRVWVRVPAAAPLFNSWFWHSSCRETVYPACPPCFVELWASRRVVLLLVGNQGVLGSNPPIPFIFFGILLLFFFCLICSWCGGARSPCVYFFPPHKQ